MEIPKQYKSLEYLHDVKWNDIFSVWRSREAYQNTWKEHWEERGFDSWDEWRKNYASPIKPKDKNWKIYKINDIADIQEIYGVPSRAWIKNCYDGEITMKLGDILNHPMVKDNGKIEAILNNFPYQTMFTGIINGEKIVLIEGMHRALASAEMYRKNIAPNTIIVIALSEHSGEIPKIGKGDNKN